MLVHFALIHQRMTGGSEYFGANDIFKKLSVNFKFKFKFKRRQLSVKSERLLEETDLRYADCEDSVAQLLPHKQPKNLGGGGELLCLVN